MINELRAFRIFIYLKICTTLHIKRCLCFLIYTTGTSEIADFEWNEMVCFKTHHHWIW